MKKQNSFSQKLLFSLLLVLFCALPVSADTTILELRKIPNSMDEFLTLRDEISGTPEGGAALFVSAMLIYTGYSQAGPTGEPGAKKRTPDQELAIDCFTVALDRSEITRDSRGYKGYRPSNAFLRRLKESLERKPYIAPSYILGTSPAGGYVLPRPPYRVEVSRNPYSVIDDETVKVFVTSTGADSPRPVTLKKNNRGIWKVAVQSLILGIRPPEENIDDDL